PPHTRPLSSLQPPVRSPGARAVMAGLAGCVALAAAALALAELPAIKGTLHLSALLLVILLGMAWKSVVHVPEALLPGIRMAQRPVLRWAVAGLGFRLSIGELFRIGAPALAVVTISTFAALGCGWGVARRLAVGERLGLLLGG